LPDTDITTDMTNMTDSDTENYRPILTLIPRYQTMVSIKIPQIPESITDFFFLF